MSIQDALGGIRAMASSRNLPKGTGSDAQPKYFDSAQSEFLARRGSLSPNTYSVEIETEAFAEAYFTCPARISDPISPVATSIQRPDSYKLLKPLQPIGFLHMGTKVRFNYSKKHKSRDTWLVVSPENMSSSIPGAQIRKCGNVYQRLDYYGNLIVEPFIKDDATSTAADGNTGSSQTDIQTQRDAFSCIMQCNDRTKDMANETFMVLGGMGYRVRGLNNHSREFTDDPNSVRLLYFTIYRDNANAANDDLERDIANANLCQWTLALSADSMTVLAGDTGTLSATALRNGAVPQKPYGFIWESSDEAVLTIADGAFTAHETGAATVTCRLAENPSIFASSVVTVEEVAFDDYRIAFEPSPPAALEQYDSVILGCYVLNNGEKQSIPVTFGFSGVGVQFYSVSQRTDNTVRLTANAPASNALIVTCTTETPIGELTTTAQIALLGL